MSKSFKATKCTNSGGKFFSKVELERHAEVIHVNPHTPTASHSTVTRINHVSLSSAEERIDYRSQQAGLVNGKTPFQAAVETLKKVRKELANRSMEFLVYHLLAALYVGYAHRRPSKREEEFFDFISWKCSLIRRRRSSATFTPVRPRRSSTFRPWYCMWRK